MIPSSFCGAQQQTQAVFLGAALLTTYVFLVLDPFEGTFGTGDYDMAVVDHRALDPDPPNSYPFASSPSSSPSFPPSPPSPPPDPSGGRGGGCRIAVLLVGHYKIVKAEEHADVFLRDVLEPLRPDVFLSSDLPSSCGHDPGGGDEDDLRTFASKIRGYLKGAVLTNSRDDRQTLDCFGGSSPLANATGLPVIPDLQFLLTRTGGPKNGGSGPQWRRLKYAWDRMLRHEAAQGFSYDAVIKIRFDGIPGPWLRAAVCSPPKGRALHAMSDHAFWGTRDVFSKAVEVNDAIMDWFNGKRKAPNSRPFAVRPLLQTFLSAHPWTFAGFPKYWYYTKLVAMWLPDIRADTNAPWNVDASIDQIRRLYCSGHKYVDPLVTDIEPFKMRPGPLHGRIDMHGGFAAGEPNFVQWMVANNVTMCEIGAGITHILFKGKIEQHPTLDPPCKFVEDDFSLNELCSQR
mmetsp:Transcript_30201/g.73507  ORF Transcript_30201/g.73507 Transcript_30201/m.73507 type:complete len:458 (+) Transcript_30201:245-1618(+)